MSKAKFNGLIYLVEKISRQPNIQTVARLLLAAFSQTYNESWEQKRTAERLEKLTVWLDNPLKSWD